MTVMGTVLPRGENYVEINKSVRDAWEIPVLNIRAKYTDNEFNMARDAMNTLAGVCHDAGFQVLAHHDKMVPPGESIHELGTCRMGDNPKTSVLNQYCQAWDCKNVFITDAAPFVSNADKNPTLTISALGWRTSEYIADEVKKRNVKV